MESQGSSVEIFETFKWKIENFSQLNVDKIYSESFIVGGYPWRILLFPKGNKNKGAVNHLSIYLEVVKTANMSEGWSRDVKFKLFLFNQLDSNMTIISKETKHEFNANNDINWGYVSFVKLTDLHDAERGFIVKDTCIVGAEVFVSKSCCEKQVNQVDNSTLSPVSIEPTKKVDAELGYAALGKVIHFFKTRKVKDMNEQVCKELQDLWDELEKFQFDVTWLEPHVQSALGMKRYVEKVLEAEKLKQNMIVLELEMERLKEKLVAAELNIDVERDLLNAKGFKEIGFDSDLGCVIWRP
ncbi:ubiquitin-specific protease [Trifolium repens]|nr:ubiquitin-specific protease [Trifolium repens]